MITITDKVLYNKIKAGEAGVEEVAKYLMYNFPVAQIAEAYAEDLITDAACNNEPITVSEDEYNRIASMFRVKGYRMDSEGERIRETRGRKPKVKEDL